MIHLAQHLTSKVREPQTIVLNNLEGCIYCWRKWKLSGADIVWRNKGPLMALNFLTGQVTIKQTNSFLSYDGILHILIMCRKKSK